MFSEGTVQMHYPDIQGFSVWRRQGVKSEAPFDGPADPILHQPGDYDTGGSDSVNMDHKQNFPL